jgi:hypothetical protein
MYGKCLADWSGMERNETRAVLHPALATGQGKKARRPSSPDCCGTRKFLRDEPETTTPIERAQQM